MAFGERLERFQVQRAAKFEFGEPVLSSFKNTGMVCGLLSKASKTTSTARTVRVEGRLESGKGTGEAVLLVAGMSCNDILPGDRLTCYEKRCRVLSVEKGDYTRLTLSQWEVL